MLGRGHCRYAGQMSIWGCRGGGGWQRAAHGIHEPPPQKGSAKRRRGSVQRGRSEQASSGCQREQKQGCLRATAAATGACAHALTPTCR